MTILEILVAARWIHFAALFFLFGVPLSCLLMHAADDTGAHAVFRRTNYLLWIAALVALASGLLWIAAIIANMVGSFADATTADTLNAFFFETQFGPVVIVRLILLAAVGLTIFLPSRIRRGAWLVIGAGLLVDQAWLGHAANGGATLFGALMIGIYCTHVLAAAAWVGGLPVLLFMLSAPFTSEEKINSLLHFSTMATAAVTLIVFSGMANAMFRVHGHPTQLLGTIYGDILLTKVTLVILMLVLAGYNRLIARPRIGTPVTSAADSNLVVSIAVELLLGAGVIGATALLGVTPPPT